MQVDTAALRLRDSILTSAETEGLTYQAYWLSTTLALGAFLKARLPSLRPPCKSAPEALPSDHAAVARPAHIYIVMIRTRHD